MSAGAISFLVRVRYEDQPTLAQLATASAGHSTAVRAGPREAPGARGETPARLKRRRVIEVAALGLPLPTGVAFAIAALAGPFDFGRGPLEAGPDLVGLQLSNRPLLPLGGLPAPLAQPPSDHHPVALGQGVGQVLGLAAPDVDL